MYIAQNNAIIGRKCGIFPNFVDKFKEIVFVALKSWVGILLSSLVVVLPAIIVCCLAFIANIVKVSANVAQINVICNTIIVVVCIVVFVYLLVAILALVGVTFEFMQNLHFKDWFSYKKGFDFVKKTGKSGSIWFLKISLLSVPIFFFSFHMGTLETKYLSESVELLILSGTFLTIVETICCVYVIDVTAQLFDELREKNILPPLEQ